MMLERRRATVSFFIAAALLTLLVACGPGDSTTAPAGPAADVEVPDNPDSPPPPITPTPTPVDRANDADANEAIDAEPNPTPEPPMAPALQTEPAIEPVSFDNDFGTSIAPILANNCARCHNDGGPGTVHWTLATADDAFQTSQLLAAAVGSGYMPPWPASDASVDFSNHRGLRDDQRQAIIDWAVAGGELDVDPTSPLISPLGPPALATVDAVVAPPEPYQPEIALRDDYRCFIYDPDLAGPAGLTGYNFVPDKTDVVHHAVGYILSGSAMPQAVRADAESAGGGWPCFGSTDLPADDDLFLAWAPGQEATEYPAGSALQLSAGDFMVVQIHYHYEGDAPADLSELELAFVDADSNLDEILIDDYVAPAEIPCRADEVGPLCDRNAAMANAIDKYGREGVPADSILRFCGYQVEDFAAMTDGVARAQCEWPVQHTGELISVFGHEHELGASFRMTLNPGRPDEVVLLDIPKWDFQWQYNYDLVKPIQLKSSDTIGIECSWDRSLRDPSLEPAYIVWADGTDDEMCFASIIIRR